MPHGWDKAQLPWRVASPRACVQVPAVPNCLLRQVCQRLVDLELLILNWTVGWDGSETWGAGDEGGGGGRDVGVLRGRSPWRQRWATPEPPAERSQPRLSVALRPDVGS